MEKDEFGCKIVDVWKNAINIPNEESIFIPSKSALTWWTDILRPKIERVHKLTTEEIANLHHDFSNEDFSLEPPITDEEQSLYVLSCWIRVCRNIDGYPTPVKMTTM